MSQLVDDYRLAASGNPCCCSVRRANGDWEQAARRLSTCCETENFRLNVTPSILIDSTRASPEIAEGGPDCNLLREASNITWSI